MPFGVDGSEHGGGASSCDAPAGTCGLDRDPWPRHGTAAALASTACEHAPLRLVHGSSSGLSLLALCRRLRCAASCGHYALSLALLRGAALNALWPTGVQAAGSESPGDPATAIAPPTLHRHLGAPAPAVAALVIAQERSACATHARFQAQAARAAALARRKPCCGWWILASRDSLGFLARHPERISPCPFTTPPFLAEPPSPPHQGPAHSPLLCDAQRKKTRRALPLKLNWLSANATINARTASFLNSTPAATQAELRPMWFGGWCFAGGSRFCRPAAAGAAHPDDKR